MTFKKIGDAASNVVRMLREDKDDPSPEYGELCESFGKIIDDAVDRNIAPWEVVTALLHALAGLISQMDPEADEDVELSLFRSIPKIFEWAAKVREGAA